MTECRASSGCRWYSCQSLRYVKCIYTIRSMHLCYGLQPMDLRALRSFVVVADYAGFSRAAEHLGISQPALSRQISALESELDVRLFDRIGRQTILTPAGQDLLGRGRSLLRDAELIRSRAKEIADSLRHVAPRRHATIHRKLRRPVTGAISRARSERGDQYPGGWSRKSHRGHTTWPRSPCNCLTPVRDRTGRAASLSNPCARRRPESPPAQLQEVHRRDGIGALPASAAQKELSDASAVRLCLQDFPCKPESAAR